MTTTDKNLSQMIIGGLRSAATELEELQVQIALGKAEAKDMFEDIKNTLHTRIQQVKQNVRQARTNEDLLPVVNAFEHLQIQLALGLAETKETFEEQKKKIESSLNSLENSLKSESGEHIAQIHLEIEKFKAKLQLLALNYKLKKIGLHYDLEQRKEEFEKTLNTLKLKLDRKETAVKQTWEHFKTEVKDAFGNLTKNFLPLD